MLLQAHPLKRRVAVLAQPIASPSRTLSVFASLAKTQRRLPAALSVEGSALLVVHPCFRGPLIPTSRYCTYGTIFIVLPCTLYHVLEL